jgi:hypothetical protein
MATPGGAHATWEEFTIDDIFTAPTPPAVIEKPQRPQRQRRTFDMSAVRRSTRLAKKPSMPAIQRAQRNIIRKLGLSEDELRPIEELLHDFINMFSGPLPEQVVAGMTAIFDLDNDEAENVNDALLQHAGATIEDLQEDVAAEQA